MEYLVRIVNVATGVPTFAAPRVLSQNEAAMFASSNGWLAAIGHRLETIVQADGTGLPVDWPAVDGGNGGALSLPDLLDVQLAYPLVDPGDTVLLAYDFALEKWRAVAQASSGGGGGAAWTGTIPLVQPSLADYTQWGAAPVTFEENDIGVSIVCPEGDANPFRDRLLLRDLPAAPYEIVIGFIPDYSATNYERVGVVWKSATDYYQSYSWSFHHTGQNSLVMANMLNRDSQNGSAGMFVPGDTYTHGPLRWFKLKDDNVHRTVHVSNSGLHWRECWKQLRADFQGIPTKFGFHCMPGYGSGVGKTTAITVAHVAINP